MTFVDIAREAGVSHGTVSNVFNKNGKVSVEKIRLVEMAAKKLGYHPNISAKQLRQGLSKVIAVVLPTISQPYGSLYMSIKKSIEALNYDLMLFVTDDVEANEIIASQKILSYRPDAIIALSCLSNPEEVYKSNAEIILIDRYPQGLKEGTRTAGFDFKKAAGDIAMYCISKQYKNVFLFLPSIRFENERLFLDTLLSCFDKNMDVSVYTAEDKFAFRKSFDIFEDSKMPDAVVTFDQMRAETILNTASFIGIDKVPEIISLSSVSRLPLFKITQYVLDYSRLGTIIADYLVEWLMNKSDAMADFKCPNDGFRFKIPEVNACAENKVIKILMLDSPVTSAIRKLLPNFEHATGITVKIDALDYDSLYKVVSSIKCEGDYDIIRMDVAWISHMAPLIYRPLKDIKEVADEIFLNCLPVLGDKYSTTRGTAYTLPLDPSVQLMFYRKDLFEDAAIKRSYYEIYHEELKPPVTFKEYNKVSSFFTRKFNSSSPVEYGSVLTYGTAAVASADFLPRLYESNFEILDSDGNIHIDTPQALEELIDYIDNIKYTHGQPNMWWKDSVDQFAKGNAATLIVFNNYSSDLVNIEYSKIIGKIGCVGIPGCHPLMGGGVIGITKSCNQLSEVMKLLQWLYSKEISTAITLCGGISPHKDVYTEFNILSLFPWLEKCNESFRIGSRIENSEMHQFFNEKLFENIVGEEICNAVMGKITPAEALRSIQTRCQAQFHA